MVLMQRYNITGEQYTLLAHLSSNPCSVHLSANNCVTYPYTEGASSG
jgi:hypothetical protein